MDKPSWFFISVLERDSSLDNLTQEFYELCCVQFGHKNHGWKVVSFKPKRFMFHLNTTAPINQDALFDLSMCLSDFGKVISEATNSLTDTTQKYSMVFVVDSGERVSDLTKNIESFMAHMKSGYDLSLRDGYITVKISKETIEDALKVKKEIESIIVLYPKMSLITTFRNWVN